MKIEELAEQAYEEVMNQSLRPQDRRHVVAVCTRFLAAYTAQQVPVAEVMWYEPLLHDEKGCGRKIIDASMGFMDAVPLGTKLYTADQPAAVVQQRDELLASLEVAVKLNSFREFNDHIPAMKAAIAKARS